MCFHKIDKIVSSRTVRNVKQDKLFACKYIVILSRMVMGKFIQNFVKKPIWIIDDIKQRSQLFDFDVKKLLFYGNGYQPVITRYFDQKYKNVKVKTLYFLCFWRSMFLNTNWQDFTSDIWQAGLFFEKVGLT